MTFLARGVWGSLPIVTMFGPALDEFFHFQADLAEVDVQVPQHVGGHAAPLLDQAEKDVFRADVFMVETLRLLGWPVA